MRLFSRNRVLLPPGVRFVGRATSGEGQWPYPEAELFVLFDEKTVRGFPRRIHRHDRLSRRPSIARASRSDGVFLGAPTLGAWRAGSSPGMTRRNLLWYFSWARL